jgi:uncharacterized protein
MITSNEKSFSTLIHLSSLSQYFIPFGNFIFPIVLWSAKKKDSEFIDQQGKQVLNFQLSMFLYSLILCLIAIPILIYVVLKNVSLNDIINENEIFVDTMSVGNMTGFVILGIVAATIFGFLKLMEFILIIYASVKASNGENYKYPLTIPFFK